MAPDHPSTKRSRSGPGGRPLVGRGPFVRPQALPPVRVLDLPPELREQHHPGKAHLSPVEWHLLRFEPSFGVNPDDCFGLCPRHFPAPLPSARVQASDIFLVPLVFSLPCISEYARAGNSAQAQLSSKEEISDQKSAEQ